MNPNIYNWKIEKLPLETKYNDLFKALIQLLSHQMNIKITRTPDDTMFIPSKVKSFIEYCNNLQAKNLTFTREI